MGKYLMIWYSLFEEPISDPTALTAVVHRVCSHVQQEIPYARNIEPSKTAFVMVTVLKGVKIQVVY